MKTCREIHQLVVQGADRELGWRERLTIRMHMLMCAACRQFEAQMAVIEKAWKNFPGPSASTRDPDRPGSPQCKDSADGTPSRPA